MTNANNIAARQFREMSKVFNVISADLAKEATRYRLKYPDSASDFMRMNRTLSRRVDDILRSLHGGILSITEAGIEDAWVQANAVQDVIVNNYIDGLNVSEGLTASMANYNLGALEAFTKRKQGGLNLSNRIWNYTGGAKDQLELYLSSGITQGKSAASITRDVRQVLKSPNNLFRRVRDAEGNLVLSKAAKKFHPGRGVYRSSFKNALRLTATETNASYRISESMRRQSLPFVVGVEVHLSAAHPREDICDHLQGTYPKEFTFSGWHPWCICFATTKQITKEEFKKYLKTGDIDKRKYIKAIPRKAQKYLVDHKKQLIKGNPDWLGNFTQELQLKQAVAKVPPLQDPVSGFIPAKTVGGAEDILRAGGIENVSLNGLSVDGANGVLRAINRSGNPVLREVSTYRRSTSRAAAMYSESNNSLTINLSQKPVYNQKVVPKSEKLIQLKTSLSRWEQHKIQLEGAQKSIFSEGKELKKARGTVNRLRTDIRNIERDIKKGYTSKPYTVASNQKNVSDYFEATTIHEVGHYKYHKELGGKTFHFDPIKANTEYARINKAEYFSEMYASYKLDGIEGIPEDLIKIFEGL